MRSPDEKTTTCCRKLKHVIVLSVSVCEKHSQKTSTETSRRLRDVIRSTVPLGKQRQRNGLGFQRGAHLRLITFASTVLRIHGPLHLESFHRILKIKYGIGKLTHYGITYFPFYISPQIKLTYPLGAQSSSSI